MYTSLLSILLLVAVLLKNTMVYLHFAHALGPAAREALSFRYILYLFNMELAASIGFYYLLFIM